MFSYQLALEVVTRKCREKTESENSPLVGVDCLPCPCNFLGSDILCL